MLIPEFVAYYGYGELPSQFWFDPRYFFGFSLVCTHKATLFNESGGESISFLTRFSRSCLVRERVHGAASSFTGFSSASAHCSWSSSSPRWRRWWARLCSRARGSETARLVLNSFLVSLTIIQLKCTQSNKVKSRQTGIILNSNHAHKTGSEAVFLAVSNACDSLLIVSECFSTESEFNSIVDLNDFIKSAVSLSSFHIKLCLELLKWISSLF